MWRQINERCADHLGGAHCAGDALRSPSQSCRSALPARTPHDGSDGPRRSADDRERRAGHGADGERRRGDRAGDEPHSAAHQRAARVGALRARQQWRRRFCRGAAAARPALQGSRRLADAARPIARRRSARGRGMARSRSRPRSTCELRRSRSRRRRAVRHGARARPRPQRLRPGAPPQPLASRKRAERRSPSIFPAASTEPREHCAARRWRPTRPSPSFA